MLVKYKQLNSTLSLYFYFYFHFDHNIRIISKYEMPASKLNENRTKNLTSYVVSYKRNIIPKLNSP